MIEKIKIFENLSYSAHHIAIIGHHHPDGDSVGSSTALNIFYNSIGKKSSIIMPSCPPSYLDFLYSKDEISVFTTDPHKCEEILEKSDLMVCMDFNHLSRTEEMEQILRKHTGKSVLIDHHLNPETDFFDLTISDTSQSSTCEYLFWILLGTVHISGDISKMELKCAQSLATGMITDTNNFNNSVKSSTFKMASLLMERGIEFGSITQKVFNSYTEERMRLMGNMLSDSMVIIKELNAAVMVLSLEKQRKYCYIQGDSEGFVNLPLLIKDVNVSALFTENNDTIRVSLRSKKGSISVNRLSNLFFNGGGHELAAGGKLSIPINKVTDYFIESLRTYLTTEQKQKA